MAEEQPTRLGFRPVNKAKPSGLRQKTAGNPNMRPDPAPVRQPAPTNQRSGATFAVGPETDVARLGPDEARQGLIMAIIFGKPLSKSRRRW